MTHKEKAVELYEKFRNVEFLKDFEGMNEELARQCSSIAVEWILNLDELSIEGREDLQKVKEEIYKL